MKHRTFFILFWSLFALFIVGLLLGDLSPIDQRYVIFRKGEDFLADFLQQIRYVWDRNPYFDERSPLLEHIYPPLAYLLIYPISMIFHGRFSQIPTLQELQSDDLTVLLGLTFSIASALILFILIFISADKRRSLACLLPLVLSGITLFSIERANLIWIAAFGVAGFFLLHDASDPKRKAWAALSISVAASIKIFPVIALFVWLNKKDLKWFLLAGICTCMFGFLPLFFFQNSPIENSLQLIANVSDQGKYYFLHCFHFSITIPAYICGVLRLFSPTLEESIRLGIRIPFTACGLICLFVILKRQLRTWERFFLLASAVTLIPGLSMYYTMLYFLPAIYLYLKDEPNNILFDVLFATLLTPFQFFVPTYDGHEFCIAPFIASLVTFTITAMIVISHLRSK